MIDTAEIDERIAKCERILKDNPHSQVFAALADAHRKKGELDAAFRTCRRGLRLYPEYGSAHLVMARINFDRKMYDWAEKELQEAIRLDGRSRVTDMLEVEILIKQGFYSKAGVRLQELTSYDPGSEYLRSLKFEIEEGKANKKAKLAETVGFYRASASDSNDIEEIPGISEDVEEFTHERALEAVARFPNVELVIYADHDGHIVSSVADDKTDIDTYSTALSEICKFIESSLDAELFGRWQDVYIENDNKSWLIFRFPERILMLACNGSVSLGSLRLRLSRSIEVLGTSQ